jgi:hypothetical protein
VTSSKTGDRSYKRSWKNLLINKRYQLRFTLFMVGLTSLLMAGLGIWVMWVANETTEVSMTSVRGEACPKVPVLEEGVPAGGDEGTRPAPSMKPGDPAGHPAAPSAGHPTAPGAGHPTAPGAVHSAGSAAEHPAVPAVPAAGDAPSPAAGPSNPGGPDKAGAPGAPGAPSPAAGGEERHATVQIDESSMTLTQTLPPDLADRFVAHWTCELRQAATFDRLERGRLRILWAMIATGLLLVLGLAVYGIKMTHRVAGPLFKVTLYLTKMREGRYDKVYNLRKGDQLVEFYDHFKLAHGGIVAMQQDDIAKIKAVIAAAEAAGVGEKPAVVELREMLARKEKSIE